VQAYLLTQLRISAIERSFISKNLTKYLVRLKQTNLQAGMLALPNLIGKPLLLVLRQKIL
jgi:hypothetical protein